MVAVIDISQVSSNQLNPLSLPVRRHILQSLAEAEKDPNVSSIVLTGGASFSAGADLKEFARLLAANDSTHDPDSTVKVVEVIENCSKPVVAAIAGSCLGGGLEVALACHARVCDPTARLGLTEVRVGLIPGAGGTQRLPRLVGLQEALGMILTGVPVVPKKALKIGLVDAVVEKPADLLSKAQEWARFCEVKPLRRVGQLPIRESPPQAHVMLHMASLQLPRHGSEGSRAALEAVRAATCLPLMQGMKVEEEKFLEMLVSPQGQAYRHAFFAVRTAQKLVATPPGPIPKMFQTAVVGAGTMGSGIAYVLLEAGFAVTLVDNNAKALEKGMAFLHNTIESRAQRKKVHPKKAAAMSASLSQSQKLSDLSNCQLVVEAVIESLPIKQDIFTQLNRITPPDAILLSNTSTLDIDKMASVLDASRRARFAGWHFFSPAHVMKLVEVVRGSETSIETVAFLQALTKRIGKIGVVVGNCDGFCGNRLLKSYSAETVMLLAEARATVASVDKALLDFGMALGPFQMGDLAGNDVGFFVRVERGWAKKKPSDPVPPNRPARYSELADDMVSVLGRNGQKAMKGWYNYDPKIGKGRKALPSPDMDAFIRKYQSVQRPLVCPQEVIERCLYPLVNEGFKCLEEGICRCPSDVDVVYLYGYGWPAWRGGPMHWADHEVGLPNLLARLQEFSRQFPGVEHYEPSELLRRCVSMGVTVEEYYRDTNQSRSRL